MNSVRSLAVLCGWLALAGPAGAGLAFYQDLRLAADLDGDGRNELVVPFWNPGARREAGQYLAVIGLDGGAPRAWFIDLGSALRILDLRAEEGRLVLEVIQSDSDGREACCHQRKVLRRWVLRDGALVEQASETLGPTSIEDLAGLAWRLETLNGEPVSQGPTLIIEKARLHGNTGCNDYFVRAADGEERGGALKMGPVGSTRKTCQGPSKVLEKRYLEALRRVERFEVQGDRLRLVWRNEQTGGALVFREMPLNGAKSR